MPTESLDPPTARGPGRPRHDAEADSAPDVREQLLEAATELAVEQGFDACGLREIATRAAVSPGMIAYYFGDRQGLHEAMFQRAFERVGDQVRRAIAEPDAHGHDRLDEIVRIQVEAIAADPWLPQLLLREVLARRGSPMREELGEQIGRGPLVLLIDWLREEQARGVLRADFDPRMMAVTIASLTTFPFLMLSIVGEQIGLELGDAFPERLIEHNQKLLTDGLRARSEESR